MGAFALYRHKEILKKFCSQKPLVRFLAPLAEGQRAIVMAWGRRASVNFFFKKLLLKNY